MHTVALLKQLVQIESYSGCEENLANFIVEWGKDHDLFVEKQDSNVIIKFLKHSHKALIFNAHMDTVKAGALDLWSVPPFGSGAGIVKDNKLYGLGASDDKAAIASFLTLATQLHKTVPPVDVFVVFVTLEEISGAGSQSFIRYFQKNYGDKYEETAAVLGEPTDLKFVEFGHRGNIFLKVTTSGNSGHGSQPVRVKKHAIYENIEIIRKLTKLGAFLSEKYADSALGVPSFCLTGIQSDSSSVNNIPSSCYSTWDVRTTPKLHDQALLIIQKEMGPGVKIEYMSPPAPCGLTSPKSRVVTLFQKLVENMQTKISQGSNDICFFTQAGIPAVTFGPGKKDVIHKPNEYVHIDAVEKSVMLYKQLLEAF